LKFVENPALNLSVSALNNFSCNFRLVAAASAALFAALIAVTAFRTSAEI
jgi:hypothetical protein